MSSFKLFILEAIYFYIFSGLNLLFKNLLDPN